MSKNGIEIHGLDEFSSKLEALSDNFETTAKRATYEAAALVADAIKQNLNEIDTLKHNGQTNAGGKVDGLTAVQKKDLIDSFGISKFADFEAGLGSFLNVSLGFDGCGSHPTASYPQGLPNQLLARAVESGTSFRAKHPFVRPAVNRTKEAAIEKMRSVIEEEIKEKI